MVFLEDYLSKSPILKYLFGFCLVMIDYFDSRTDMYIAMLEGDTLFLRFMDQSCISVFLK